MKIQTMPTKGFCAHRGANNTHPENTLSAFREAIRLGTQMIEFDVDLTVDKYPIIMHDHTVDRTTNGQGTVTELSFSDIRKLDAGEKMDLRFVGEKIPTLDEVLEIMPRNIWLNIHLKGGYEVGKTVAQAVLKHNRIHQSVIASGKEGIMGAQSIAPDILICNMENQGCDTRYVDETLDFKSQFIQFCGGIADARDIQRLKENRVAINYFFSNDVSELRMLFDSGINFILTDKIKEMMDSSMNIGILPVVPDYLNAGE